ncbi:MAG: type II CAAX endopeptidase family protein [Acidobacteriota bacterium]
MSDPATDTSGEPTPGDRRVGPETVKSAIGSATDHPSAADRRRAGGLAVGFVVALLAMAALRWSGPLDNALTPFSRFATLGYIAATVCFSIALVRAGVPFDRLGFGDGPRWRHLGLALVGVVALRVLGGVVLPWVQGWIAAPRDLERFSAVDEGSLGALATYLAVSWSFAAFGEELAYRVVLMRALAVALGDGRRAQAAALVVQAGVFGLVHAYQGAMGVVGATLSGLVYGALALAAQGSIWPSAFAHGANNSINLLRLFVR